MRTGKRTQDFYLIKGQKDAHYYAAGIPSTAWGPLIEDKPKFKLLVLDGESSNLFPKVQEEWFERMRSGEFFSLPYLILLSASADDSASISHGYDLMKRALSKNIRVQITESSGIKEEATREETVYMLTNVYDEAPPERMQDIRDWCHRHETSFRILCAAGDPAVLIRRLKLSFNAVFYLDSRITTERNMA